MRKYTRACPTYANQRYGNALCANRTNEWRDLTAAKEVIWAQRKYEARTIHLFSDVRRKFFPNVSMLLHNEWTACDADTNVFKSDRPLSL